MQGDEFSSALSADEENSGSISLPFSSRSLTVNHRFAELSLRKHRARNKPSAERDAEAPAKSERRATRGAAPGVEESSKRCPETENLSGPPVSETQSESRENDRAGDSEKEALAAHGSKNTQIPSDTQALPDNESDQSKEVQLSQNVAQVEKTATSGKDGDDQSGSDIHDKSGNNTDDDSSSTSSSSSEGESDAEETTSATDSDSESDSESGSSESESDSSSRSGSSRSGSRSESGSESETDSSDSESENSSQSEAEAPGECEKTEQGQHSAQGRAEVPRMKRQEISGRLSALLGVIENELPPANNSPASEVQFAVGADDSVTLDNAKKFTSASGLLDVQVGAADKDDEVGKENRERCAPVTDDSGRKVSGSPVVSDSEPASGGFLHRLKEASKSCDEDVENETTREVQQVSEHSETESDISISEMKDDRETSETPCGQNGGESGSSVVLEVPAKSPESNCDACPDREERVGQEDVNSDENVELSDINHDDFVTLDVANDEDSLFRDINENPSPSKAQDKQFKEQETLRMTLRSSPRKQKQFLALHSTSKSQSPRRLKRAKSNPRAESTSLDDERTGAVIVTETESTKQSKASSSVVAASSNKGDVQLAQREVTDDRSLEEGEILDDSQSCFLDGCSAATSSGGESSRKRAEKRKDSSPRCAAKKPRRSSKAPERSRLSPLRDKSRRERSKERQCHSSRNHAGPRSSERRAPRRGARERYRSPKRTRHCRKSPLPSHSSGSRLPRSRSKDKSAEPSRKSRSRDRSRSGRDKSRENDVPTSRSFKTNRPSPERGHTHQKRRDKSPRSARDLLREQSSSVSKSSNRSSRSGSGETGDHSKKRTNPKRHTRSGSEAEGEEKGKARRTNDEKNQKC